MTGYPLHRENRENSQKKNPCQEKHREFGNFAKTHRENTRNLICCKFPDSKGKR